MCTSIVVNKKKTIVGWNLDILDMEYRIRPEGIIYFVAAACFASLERACSKKVGEAGNNREITDREDGFNE